MWNWLFIPKGLPRNYSIKTYIDRTGGTVYSLMFDERIVAQENSYLQSHRSCVRALRRAAWTRHRNGIVD